jgi:CRISPR-associated exonuclease Cas4
MYTEDQLAPISALQHLIYCPRQCALIHLERQWAENRLTVQGRHLHEKAHDVKRGETRPGMRIARGLSLRSYQLGLTGQADVVEFHEPPDGSPFILPIEYKRGKPKKHDADSVQLCAQAMCLEEMLHMPIGQGCLFYGKTHRRQDVLLNEALRRRTVEIARAFHDMLASGVTPAAQYSKEKCDRCSLVSICMPRMLRQRKTASAMFNQSLDLALEAL